MANTKISALTSGSPAQASDALPIARSGSSYKLAVSDLSTAALANSIPAASDLNGIHNFSTSSLTPGGNAGTYYYIAPSALTMPAAYKTGIGAGTVMRWYIRMSKSVAGTAAFNIRLYYGTNGSISDTTLATQSIGTATAALDDMDLLITLTFTSASAAYWSITAAHSAASGVGFGCAIGSQGFSGTLSGLTTSTGSLIFGVG